MVLGYQGKVDVTLNKIQKYFKMVKKKIDNRIRVLIENGVKLGHRTMFLLVGDKSRDQVRFYH